MEDTVAAMKFSCSECRTRKIKCERLQPCSNCVKAGRTCSFVPPARGERKRVVPAREGLHAKLRCYENLLKSYGAKIDSPAPINESEDSDTDVEMEADKKKTSDKTAFVFQQKGPKLISKNGSSRYFDGNTSSLWANFNEEFPELEPDELAQLDLKNGHKSAAYSSYELAEEQALLLGGPTRINLNINMALLHPPAYILIAMRDIYVERVDTLIKVVHFLTFWASVEVAMQTPDQIPEPMQALIFSFYLVTISAMNEEDCIKKLGDNRLALASRYRVGARQALINARLLQTTSFMTLQAYIIYLMGIKGFHQSDSIFLLCGIAVRLARRMGLHRDGTAVGLSPFETEIRRRVWWQLIHLDCRVSDLAGTKPSLDLFQADTKPPQNYEDEDLVPGMKELPKPRTGLTSSVLLTMKGDILRALRDFSPRFSVDVGWDGLISGSRSTTTDKDRMIQELQDKLESNYLRYCDIANPLHHFVSIIGRSAICKMKIFAHSPRQWSDNGLKVPPAEQDFIFANGVKLLEYCRLMYTTPTLMKFIWQVSSSHLWDVLLYVLIEVRHRKLGPDVDHAWEWIDSILTHYTQMFQEITEALYLALGAWILQVWDECEAEKRTKGFTAEGPLPLFVDKFERQRRLRALKKHAQPNHAPPPPSFDKSAIAMNENGFSALPWDSNESYDYSSFLSYDLGPSEWAQLDTLFANSGNVQGI